MGDASSVLVWISCDPRQSPRANEGLREALGFIASQLSVRLVLAGEAVRLLSDDSLDFADGETIEKNLGYFRKWKTPVFVAPAPGGGRADPPKNEAGLAVDVLDAKALTTLLAETDRFVRF